MSPSPSVIVPVVQMSVFVVAGGCASGSCVQTTVLPYAVTGTYTVQSVVRTTARNVGCDSYGRDNQGYPACVINIHPNNLTNVFLSDIDAFTTTTFYPQWNATISIGPAIYAANTFPNTQPIDAYAIAVDCYHAPIIDGSHAPVAMAWLTRNPLGPCYIDDHFGGKQFCVAAGSYYASYYYYYDSNGVQLDPYARLNSIVCPNVPSASPTPSITATPSVTPSPSASFIPGGPNHVQH